MKMKKKECKCCLTNKAEFKGYCLFCAGYISILKTDELIKNNEKAIEELEKALEKAFDLE